MRARALLGAACVIAGLVLALLSLPRYYAIFAIGCWLLVDTWEERRHGTSVLAAVRRSDQARLAWLWLYGWFVVTGLVVDGAVGLRVTSLWAYPSYTEPWLYAALYLVAYPAGGLFTVGLLRAVFGPSALSAPSREASWSLRAGLAVIALLASLIAVELADPPIDALARLVVFALLFALAMLALELLAMSRRTCGPIRVVLKRPQLAPQLLVMSVLAAFIHELPNVPPHEWRYQNLALAWDIQGVPLLVLGGWPILFLLPWAVANALRRDGDDPFGPQESAVERVVAG